MFSGGWCLCLRKKSKECDIHQEQIDTDSWDVIKSGVNEIINQRKMRCNDIQKELSKGKVHEEEEAAIGVVLNEEEEAATGVVLNDEDAVAIEKARLSLVALWNQSSLVRAKPSINLKQASTIEQISFVLRLSEVLETVAGSSPGLTRKMNSNTSRFKNKSLPEVDIWNKLRDPDERLAFINFVISKEDEHTSAELEGHLEFAMQAMELMSKINNSDMSIGSRATKYRRNSIGSEVPTKYRRYSDGSEGATSNVSDPLTTVPSLVLQLWNSRRMSVEDPAIHPIPE